jgi:hypothetical protein
MRDDIPFENPSRASGSAHTFPIHTQFPGATPSARRRDRLSCGLNSRMGRHEAAPDILRQHATGRVGSWDRVQVDP